MSEEEKEAIEQLKSWREYIINHRDTVNKANDIEFYLRTALNLIEKQQKELNSLKEIEQLHKEENGKLRVELEKYKLLNANIEKANKIIKSNKLNEKEREIIETYRKLIEETGRNDWIICNPKTMWSNYFVRKDKIKEMKEFYINEYTNKNITLIPLKNIIENINVLLEEK